MMYKKLVLVFIACFTVLFVNGQQVVRNHGFEYVDAGGNLIGWGFVNAGQKYKINVDTSVRHSGNCSISISSDVKDAGERGAAVGLSTLKAFDLHTKKSVRVSGYIKMESLSDGMAVIGLRLDGIRGPIAEVSSDPTPIEGSLNWTKFTAELPLVVDVQSITYGIFMSGLGKIWVDDFEVFVDDVLITDTIPLPDR